MLLLNVVFAETHLNEKSQEIVSLIEELGHYANKGTMENTTSQTENTLKKEIDQLKNELKCIQVENENLLQQNEKYLKQVSLFDI